MEVVSSNSTDVQVRVLLGSSASSPNLAWDSSANSRAPSNPRKPKSRSHTTPTPSHSNLSLESDLFNYYTALSNQFFSSDARNAAHAMVEADDDPLDFFDDSLFFVNRRDIEGNKSSRKLSSSFLPPGLQPPSLSPPKSRSSGKENRKVSFSNLLNDCHEHRLSTISESQEPNIPRSPIPAFAEPSGSVSEELETEAVAPPIPATTTASVVTPAPSPPSRSASRKSKRVSWATETRTSSHFEENLEDDDEPALLPQPQALKQSQKQQKPKSVLSPTQIQIQRAGIKRLLDYIVPYPSRSIPISTPIAKNKRERGQGRSRSASAPSRMIEPIPISRNSDSSGSETSSLSLGHDEGWVMHGFFEIRHHHQEVQ